MMGQHPPPPPEMAWHRAWRRGSSPGGHSLPLPHRGWGAAVPCRSPDRGSGGAGRVEVPCHLIPAPRRDKAGGYGIQALGGMLVEHVCGDFLNVVGFPLNRFCKELARLYYPPRAQDVQRLKHDSIPAVDTFEDLSDAEGGGPDPAGSHEGGRGGEKVGERPQALGAPHADLNGAAENRPPFPTGLLELMDAFKASKVPV